MIILVSGGTHSGKTLFAQKLLEKYKFPYLSIDHLKMGLIRSGNTDLKPESSDEKLTEYLWPIVCEIIKTAIENNQNLIIEGYYIPFDWKKAFSEVYMNAIRYTCLILSEKYIENNFDKIKAYRDVIEKRFYEFDLTKEGLIEENKRMLEKCKEYSLSYMLVEEEYEFNI